MASEKTVFEKIIAGEIPARIIHQDEHCVAIHDVAPQGPVHLLVIPRKVIPRLAESTDEDIPLLGHLLRVAASQAEKEGLTKGFRVIINNGRDGGESVPHLHVHVIGGRALSWPPG